MSPNEKTDAPHDGALELLQPPTAAMLLEPDTADATQRLDQYFKHGTADAQTVQAVLDALNGGPPLTYTRGGGSGAASVVDVRPSILDAILGLYVPVEAEPAWVPASQRYIHEQRWSGSQGSSAAYKRNGKLTCIQGTNTTVGSESTWAGVYASFRPNQARFGRRSRVTIDPEVYWTGRDILDVSHVWNRMIDGQIWFDYRIWTVVYQFNVADGRYERLPNQSARATTVGNSRWHIRGGGGMSGMGGTLPNGAGVLAFVVEPNRTYVFGVVVQMQVSHSLRRTDGQPIPQPSLGGNELTAYGLLKADVPAIYMSHVVLDG